MRSAADTACTNVMFSGDSLSVASSRKIRTLARRFSKTSGKAGYALPLPLNNTISSVFFTRNTFKWRTTLSGNSTTLSGLKAKST